MSKERDGQGELCQRKFVTPGLYGTRENEPMGEYRLEIIFNFCRIDNTSAYFNTHLFQKFIIISAHAMKK